MINFALKCDQDHKFDSWFQSADAFDTLKAAGMVACPVCGSTNVDKAMMAPRLSSGRRSGEGGKAAPEADTPPQTGALSQPSSPAEQAMAELRKKIETHSEYVGHNFVTEARNMHSGDSPERPIHGEAKPEEARKLIEDGVPVTPLPFLSGRKTN